MVIGFSIFLLLIFTISGQRIVPWLAHTYSDNYDNNPFNRVINRLFKEPNSFYTFGNALVDTLVDDDDSQAQEDLDAVANKAGEFLEQMISFLDGKEQKAQKTGRGYHKKKVNQKGTLTLGEHVCVREKRLPIVLDNRETSCTVYKRATRCVTGDGNETLIRIVECCLDYWTNDIRNGCVKKVGVQPLPDITSYSNITCIDELNVPNTDHGTLLIPFDEKCTNESVSSRDWSEYMLDQPYYSYELLDSQKLPTHKENVSLIVSVVPKEKSGESKPLLNCIEIADEDLPWVNGVVHLLRGPLVTSTVSLLDIITNDTSLSSFADLLTDDIRDRLASLENVSTVFVFNNTAFDSLSPSLQARLRQRRGCTKDLIKEHIYNEMICASRMLGTVKSIAGNKHNFYTQHNANGTEFVRLDNAKIVKAGQIAANGIIHLLDDVIFSEQFYDWRDLLELPEKSFLNLLEANLGAEDEPTAIFVPPPESYQNLTDAKAFLMNHIAFDSVEHGGTTMSTAFGSKVPTNPSSLKPSFGCAKTIKPSLKFCNTTLYFLDKALPEITDTLEDIILSNNEFSVFASLLNETDMDLGNGGPYTVLLPPNDALSKNQIRTLKSNATLAGNFVKRHVFKGLICADSIAHGSPGRRPQSLVLKNVNDELYDSDLNGKKPNVAGILLQDVDKLAVNGILHLLDSPLLPNSQRRHRSFCSLFNNLKV